MCWTTSFGGLCNIMRHIQDLFVLRIFASLGFHSRTDEWVSGLRLDETSVWRGLVRWRWQHWRRMWTVLLVITSWWDPVFDLHWSKTRVLEREQLQNNSSCCTMRNHGWELPYHPLQVSSFSLVPKQLSAGNSVASTCLHELVLEMSNSEDCPSIHFRVLCLS